MTKRITLLPSIAVLLLALLSLPLASSAMAADDPPADQAQTEAPAGNPADALVVPEGGPKELLEFIEKLSGERPQVQSGEELLAFLTRSRRVILEAAEKVLASDDATDDQAALAAQYKLQALELLVRIGDAEAEGQLAEFAKELAESDRPELAQLGLQYTLLAKANEVMQSGDPEQVAQYVKEVVAYVRAAKEPGLDHLRLALQAGQLAESAQLNDVAADAYNALAEIFGKSEDAQIKSYAEKLAGSARRLQLVGNEIQVEGTLLNGEPLQWDSYRGKVVLVDYWATWCGPCVAEMPNVLANYAAYRDRGFEVIGISLDDEKQVVEQFVEQRKVPWPIMFSSDPQAAGWDHPMAVKYGIMGIPTAILVDQQGKVVTLEARGEQLGTLLAKLIGPAEQPAGEADEAKPEPDEQ